MNRIACGYALRSGGFAGCFTAANDLGLTTAVPAHVIIHTDARRRTIRLDNLAIEFKRTAPSKLYWAGRPAMRIVQALRWLKDTLPTDRDRIMAQLSVILNERRHGKALRDDLRAGIGTLATGSGVDACEG
jgi:hypothetical protein